jgi:hypothetical protein
MPEIPEIGVGRIGVPEVRAWLTAPPSTPDVPPVTLDIGVPVIDLPAFSPLDFESELQPGEITPPKPKPPKPPSTPKVKIPRIEPKPPAPVEVEEVKPLIQQVVEAIPTIPQATTVAASSVIGVSAALATPFLLKLIKPVVKKVMVKIQKTLGRQVKVESDWQRRKLQRALRK